MTAAGAGLTAMLKSTPASAELVPTSTVLFFCRLTSVRSPITAEGRITNTLPAPLFVLIPTANPPAHRPLPWPLPVHVMTPVMGSAVQFSWQVSPPVIEPFELSTQWILPPLLP